MRKERRREEEERGEEERGEEKERQQARAGDTVEVPFGFTHAD